MKRFMSLLYATALVGAGPGCSKDSRPGAPAATDGNVPTANVRPDEELLQGTWAMISLESDGRKKQDVAQGRVLINGKELTLGTEGESGEAFTFKLWPREMPKGIDLFMAEPKTPILGIYKVEGDSLTLCVRGRGGRKKDGTPIDPRELTRPSSFSSEGGNLLLVLTRKKS